LLVKSKERRVWSCEREVGSMMEMLENKAFSTESEIGRAKRRKKRIKINKFILFCTRFFVTLRRKQKQKLER